MISIGEEEVTVDKNSEFVVLLNESYSSLQVEIIGDHELHAFVSFEDWKNAGGVIEVFSSYLFFTHF